MPIFMVSVKDGAPADALESAKKTVTDQGGKVTHEMKSLGTFTADFPADQVHVLKSNEHLEVEEDKEVHTQ